jgi:hypothetical protein
MKKANRLVELEARGGEIYGVAVVDEACGHRRHIGGAVPQKVNWLGFDRPPQRRLRFGHSRREAEVMVKIIEDRTRPNAFVG